MPWTYRSSTKWWTDWMQSRKPKMMTRIDFVDIGISRLMVWELPGDSVSWFENPKIVFLSMEDKGDVVREATNCGAMGYAIEAHVVG